MICNRRKITKKNGRSARAANASPPVSFHQYVQEEHVPRSCAISRLRLSYFSRWRRRRSTSFKTLFRKRICVGVTSTNSSDSMNSNASSNVNFLAGFKMMFRSLPDARMFVNFFSFVGFTSISSLREFSPTIMPS